MTKEADILTLNMLIEKYLPISGKYINDEKKEKLILYMEHILDWNTRINVTSIKNKDEFLIKHIIDSILLIELLHKNYEEMFHVKHNIKVIDIGTGGGFPGVPLAIVMDNWNFTLLDSVRKKLSVIEKGLNILNINNVNLIHGRAEEIRPNDKLYKEFDIVTSRAVTQVDKLIDYMTPYVTDRGLMISYKGPSVDEEIEKAEKKLKKHNLSWDIKKFKLLENSRSFLIIR